MLSNDWEIRPFEAQDAAAFAALNQRWIGEMFALEETDIHQLENPQESILGRGGFIAVAEGADQVVGTGAIQPATHAPNDGRSWMEVIKMATAPQAQRSGIGAAILARLIEFAREHHADGIWLETNTGLKAAISLYQRHGFRPLSDEDIWPTPYSRCNSQMVLEL